MGNTTHFSTKERILGAAEELFAQHRFAGTSLRQVTSRADVNIAVEEAAEGLTRIDAEVSYLAAKASELPALQERLKGMVEVAGPDTEKVNNAHREKATRQVEEGVPRSLRDAVDKVVAEVQRARTSFGATRDPHLTSAMEDGVNGEVFRAIGSDLREFSATLDAAVASVAQAADRFTAALSAPRALLAQRHAEQEGAYRALVSTSEELGGRSNERAKLQKAVTAAQVHATARDAKQRERVEAVAARQEMLNKMSELRDSGAATAHSVAAPASNYSFMHVSRITSSCDNQVHRISATVMGTEVWFESPDVELRPSAEAFASAFLIPSLHIAEALEIDQPLDPVWVSNIKNILPLAFRMVGIF